MSEEAARERPRATSAVCPGLSDETSWDDAEFLRGELHNEEHLIAHAEELARAHGAPARSFGPGPLRRRFAGARERIASAYRVLASEARSRRDPSPAEEWLLDNANVVQDQIREITEDLPFGYLIELPRLTRGVMRGYPRVYALCIDYLRHTDARIDQRTLARYVLSYQAVERLTIGELWAIPIMLRLGLILSVGALAASEVRAQENLRVDVWAERLILAGTDVAAARETLAALGRQQREAVTPTFLVQLLRRLREHDAALDVVREWVAERCKTFGISPDEITRREHMRQAADQVSVGNAITSMRTVSAADWELFFERTSEVEAVLARDPAGAYVESDKATRDRCRHAVEELARSGSMDELSVARAAQKLAASATPDDPRGRRAHVGYYLIDGGRPELEREVRYRPKLRPRIVRAVLNHPALFYFGGLAVVTSALVAALAGAWLPILGSPLWLVAAMLPFGLLASEMALALVNSLAVTLLPPRLLAKLEFERGIPEQHRTLVAIPRAARQRADAGTADRGSGGSRARQSRSPFALCAAHGLHGRRRRDRRR